MELLLTWVSPKMNSLHPLGVVLMSLVAQMVKMPEMQETWVRKIPWRRTWLPTPVFLPGELDGQSSLVGLQSLGSQRVGHDWMTDTNQAK